MLLIVFICGKCLFTDWAIHSRVHLVLLKYISFFSKFCISEKHSTCHYNGQTSHNFQKYNFMGNQHTHKFQGQPVHFYGCARTKVNKLVWKNMGDIYGRHYRLFKISLNDTHITKSEQIDAKWTNWRHRNSTQIFVRKLFSARRQFVRFEHVNLFDLVYSKNRCC